MKLNLKSVTFSNFLAYGAEHRIDFRSGVHLISGPNGSGKSTINEAIYYVCFGLSFRGLNLADMINLTNKKGLLARLDFSVNGVDYAIERGMKPDRLAIYKNNEAIPLRSTKALIQEDINQLLGITPIMFKNVMSISALLNEPFMKMKLDDRRKTVDMVFGTAVFAQMLTRTKAQRNDITQSHNIRSAELVQVSSDLPHLHTQKNNIVAHNASIATRRNDQIAQIDREITELNNQIQSLYGSRATQYEALQAIQVTLSQFTGHTQAYLDECTSAISQCDTMINEGNIAIRSAQSLIPQIERRKAFFFQNSICPTCTGVIEEGRRHSALNDINSEFETIGATISHGNASIAEASEIRRRHVDVINAHNKMLAQFNHTQAQYNQNVAVITQIDTQIMQVTMLIEERRRNREMVLGMEDAATQSTDEIDHMIEMKMQMMDHLQHECTQLNHKRMVSEHMIDVLGDGGVKTFFIDSIIPVLNDRINYYLRQLGHNVEASFSSNMQIEFTPLVSGVTGHYVGMSGGEAKRVDISIFMAFIDVVKAMAGWDTNLIMFDEILDGAIDVDGIREMMISIQEMMQKRQMSSYVISHRIPDDLLGIFDSVISVEKRGCYSTMTDIYSIGAGNGVS